LVSEIIILCNIILVQNNIAETRQMIANIERQRILWYTVLSWYKGEHCECYTISMFEYARLIQTNSPLQKENPGWCQFNSWEFSVKLTLRILQCIPIAYPVYSWQTDFLIPNVYMFLTSISVEAEVENDW
jgi:hypothetical protein